MSGILDEKMSGDRQAAVDKLNNYVGELQKAFGMPTSEVSVILLTVALVWVAGAHDISSQQ